MLIRKSSAKPLPFVLGNWGKDNVQLDFDNTCFTEVKYWAKRTCHWFKLEGFIILYSSRRHYHVVFDRPVRWETNVAAMDWVALESGNLNIQKYALMQGIKKTSTLRIGNKGKKKPPKIVSHFGSQYRQVRKFLENRKVTLELIKKLEKKATHDERNKKLL